MDIMHDPTAPAHPRPALRLVSSTPSPEPPELWPAPSVVIVAECAGAQWAVSPRANVVRVLAGSPAEVGRRLGEALAVYGDRRAGLGVAT
jgi:hypothetical protein